MGYACPVCEDPQADGEHLANHLAFTAMLGDDAHETWLDDRVTDWGEMDPPELADHVVDEAANTEYPQVFEDTTGGADGHGHEHGQGGHSGHEHGQGGHSGHEHGGTARGRGDATDIADAVPGGVADVDDALGDEDVDPEDVLAEARDLTRQRRESVDGDEGEGEGEREDRDGDVNAHDSNGDGADE